MRTRKVGFIGALVSVAATMAFGVAPASADGGHGGHDGRGDHDVVNVRMIDKCDPVSFTANLGPGACSPLKPFKRTVTFDQLVASFDPVNHTASPAWRFSPSRIEIEEGDTIHATNVGGEGHSFTEVPFFGGGCVDQLNAPLGLTEVAANCPADFATVRQPGGSSDISGLSPGEHKFICVIHPWMRATVEVED
jgi:plastocyanin